MDWTIEFSWGILLTSFTGSLFFLFWHLAGRRLERAGLAGAEFGLLKMTVISFFLPAAYAFLKVNMSLPSASILCRLVKKRTLWTRSLQLGSFSGSF